MSDDLGDVLERPKAAAGKFSLREILEPERRPQPQPERQEPEQAAKETHSPLPGPGDAYKAYANVSNKMETTLRLILDGGTVRGPAYANLDSVDWLIEDKAGGEPAIILLFMGAVPKEVVISGRNLMQLFDYLGDHRIRWVRQMPKGRDFAEAGEAVVTGIEFRQPVVRL